MHNVMKNILRFIFILFLIFLSLPIFSRSYAFRGLSVTEGLSDLVVNAIYKDSLGFGKSEFDTGNKQAIEEIEGLRDELIN